MNRLTFKKYDNLTYKGFVVYADEIRTFDGKRYKIKGVRALRMYNKKCTLKDKHDFIPLNHIMYESKTVYNYQYGLIANRKNRYSEIKCLKDLTA
ncbi:TPA: hypothetical protein SFG28_002266 [Staphylococcus aureus]|uniref:Uncharacterized protein n=1 Tax=Staphylococcus aureus TaxID=1280 RepID=A0AB73JIC0_STAAU|nr:MULTISPECIES: hypothetical protein [Staphylococcus]MDU4504572.1 hypothetical protein [Staphylococcus warneri]MDU5815212.1 hypothetical protein [Staphylococcus sp.]EHR84400.1 hypothetical protein SEVCU120_2078 [Staphylococcus epidermidis VCU120]ENK02059.1 hypothetical protein SYY_02645 [Staphylococcus aureus M0408]MBD6830280.1 hypothetical protein [Staphylococcus aureus]